MLKMFCYLFYDQNMTFRRLLVLHLHIPVEVFQLKNNRRCGTVLAKMCTPVRCIKLWDSVTWDQFNTFTVSSH